MTPPFDPRTESYLQAWRNNYALLLSRLTSKDWKAEATAALENTERLSVRVTSAGLPGCQWFTWCPVSLGKLLQLFLGEEVTVTAALDEMQGEALEELVRQWCGLAATTLKPELGELSFDVAIDGAGCENAQLQDVMLANDGTQSMAVQISLDAELESFLRHSAETSEAKPPAPPRSAGRIDELLGTGNLDLLMDVELPVMLRFGSRQATLREVLDLATGAVLELDREVQEPVDLILNGKVIARGEVVIVDGNYGLRVTEVASPQQRVNSL